MKALTSVQRGTGIEHIRKEHSTVPLTAAFGGRYRVKFFVPKVLRPLGHSPVQFAASFTMVRHTPSSGTWPVSDTCVVHISRAHRSTWPPPFLDCSVRISTDVKFLHLLTNSMRLCPRKRAATVSTVVEQCGRDTGAFKTGQVTITKASATFTDWGHSTCVLRTAAPVTVQRNRFNRDGE